MPVLEQATLHIFRPDRTVRDVQLQRGQIVNLLLRPVVEGVHEACKNVSEGIRGLLHPSSGLRNSEDRSFSLSLSLSLSLVLLFALLFALLASLLPCLLGVAGRLGSGTYGPQTLRARATPSPSSESRFLSFSACDAALAVALAWARGKAIGSHQIRTPDVRGMHEALQKGEVGSPLFRAAKRFSLHKKICRLPWNPAKVTFLELRINILAG